MQRHIGDGTSDAALDQHPVESAARTDHEQDRRRGREAVVHELEQLLPVELLIASERPERKQQRYQQRDDRVTDERQCIPHRIRRVERNLGRACAEHEQHRQQYREDGDREAGHHARVITHELIGQRVVCGQVNPRCDPAGEHRAGQRRRRQPHEQGVHDGETNVCLECRHGEHRSRMRWHHAMHHRQPGNERNADLDQRRAGLPRNREHQRNQQHEPDLEEHWYAHDEGDEHDRPVHARFAEDADQGPCDARRAARLRHHLPEHGAESDDDRDETERTADAILKCLHHGRQRHPCGHAHRERNGDQHDERMQLVLRDQHDQRHDGEQRVEQQQQRIGRGNDRRCHAVPRCSAGSRSRMIASIAAGS